MSAAKRARFSRRKNQRSGSGPRRRPRSANQPRPSTANAAPAATTPAAVSGGRRSRRGHQAAATPRAGIITATGPLVRKPRPSTAPVSGIQGQARPPSSAFTNNVMASVVHSVSNMSDIAMRPKAMKAPVVASTSPPHSAASRPSRIRPSHTVAASASSAAAAGTTRAAVVVKPSGPNAAAISQYVSGGLSKKGSPR